MNISGIRPYAGPSFYNNIQTSNVTDLTTDLVTQEAEEKQNISADIAESSFSEAKNRQSFGAYAYATQYDPEASYDLKGEESDLKTLDVEKAISDMQKDQVIHQYQFFVGEASAFSTASTASAAREVENFSL
ncbi:hypothetical protein SAMN02910453_0710 [Lachnospiraceae bacterium A10]|jgi:hypothetical protein|nr:hypothetical protein SAMN02910453_0710 [Lachnospiraceae bacterium A10]